MTRDKGARLDSSYAMLTMLADVFSLSVALYVAWTLRFGVTPFELMSPLFGTWVFYGVAAMLLSDMESVFYARTAVNRSLLSFRLLRIALIVTIVYVLWVFAFRASAMWFVHSRLVIVLTFLFWVAVIIPVRLGLPYLATLLVRAGVMRVPSVRILACGNPKQIDRVRRMLYKSPLYRLLIEFVDCGTCAPTLPERLEGYLESLREAGCDDLCVVEEEADFDTIAPFIIRCREEGISISVFSRLFENIGYYDSWISFADMPAVVFFTPPMSPGAERFWRLFDVVFASAALLALLPVLAILSLAIRATSPGPVFFRQRRVGLHERLFVFLKFRSMTHDPSKNVRAHKEYFARYAAGIAAEDGNRNGFKMRDASRITPVGRIMRKTSLDELPQLWSVLRGEMSLVGPRPCISYEMEFYKPWQKRRFTVRPGLTGIWQVYGRSRLPFDAAQFLDLCYALKRSTSLNIRLILKTIPVVLYGRGGV